MAVALAAIADPSGSWSDLFSHDERRLRVATDADMVAAISS
jgi:hypothetical protein